MKKLVILGSGGYGHTVADIATQLDYECMFLDDSITDRTLSSFTEYINSYTYFIPAFGNNAFRLEWMDKIKAAEGNLVTLIHPTSYISPTAQIAQGTVVLPKAIINTDVVVGRGCIINLGAIIDHGCVIDEGCHICLGAIIKGENYISPCTKIEAGKVVQARQWPVEKNSPVPRNMGLYETQEEKNDE